MQKGKFTEKESSLFHDLEAKKEPIQSQLNDLNQQIKEAAKVVTALRDEVAKIKPKLVPLAEMQAALASATSRDKYFPDHSKNSFIDYVESVCK
jgi:peptidoglycan hydrolase CwlO-like protein